MSDAQQLTFPIDLRRCHYKGCVAPVVGSSHTRKDGHVCDHHNNIEWARALSHGKDGYWRTFGKRWLAELGVSA